MLCSDQEQIELFDSARWPRRPYCSDDLESGLRIRSLKQALTKPYIQVNPPHLRVWSVFDVDRPAGALAWEDANLLPPSWAATNKTNGHAHLVWGLRAPVLVDGLGARDAPLRYLCAVESLMREKLLRLLLQLGYAQDALVFVTNLAEARHWLAQNPAALALVDIGLPDGSGLDLIADMRAEDPAMSILVVSSWSTEDIILQALKCGATGYVLKERDDMEIALSIRSVLRGGAPIDPFIARRILEQLPDAPKAEKASPPPLRSRQNPDEEALTRREYGILQLVAEGLSNREIAERLFLSRHTIECHIKHIYRKLAVSGRTRAVYEARARGLLS